MKKNIYQLTLMVLTGLFPLFLSGQTYHNLSGGAFSQNWTNTGMITVNDDWSGVTSIIGYRGDDASLGTAVDPQTLLNPSFSTVIDVNANQADPNTFTSGGVSEFEITDPVVALQGSGTADAPNLIVFLNTTGCSSIHVMFKVRDIDGSADNSTQQFALQYRVGETGDFTNLPAAYIADATTGPSLADLVTTMDVSLPAPCENQSKVQLRFMTTNAAGSDEWIGIDDILIQQVLAPIITVTSPSAGAQWKQGSSHNITWSASNTNANVKIEFTDNASAGSPTWTTLIATTPTSAGSWTWNIPAGQPLGADCKIRITDIPQTALGLSGTFSIIPPPPSVTSIAQLRAGTIGNEYKLTSEAILTFQQTFRHQKYIQDATAGILIDDNAGLLTKVYNVGDGITGITGQLNEFGNMMQFTPIEDAPAASSSGNSISPQEITLNELVTNFDNYESELVKVRFSEFTNASGNFVNGTVYPMTDFYGGAASFRTTFYDVDYIGTPIPAGYVDIVGLPNARTDGNYLTSRNLADITSSSMTSNDIMISEIYYNPPDAGNDTIEFIELYNKGVSAVNVKDWYFSDGIQYVFPDTTIAPGAYFVLARNAFSFELTFGMEAVEWTGDLLDDEGEILKIKDASGFVKDSVYFLPTAPWPTEAAGNGPSIEICDPSLDNALGENWSAALKFAGVNAAGDSLYATPGANCSTGANLVITEIMYNPPESGTDSLEFVEIYNNGNSINLQGFSISDAFVYTFPSYDLAAGARVLLAVKAAAMLHTFGVTAMEWTSGSLSNNGEVITLRDLYGNIIDQVTYDDTAPWDTLADSFGPSLTLCDPNSNNAQPEFWKASTEFAAVNANNDSIFATPGTGCINPPPIADFTGNPTTVLIGESVQFTDMSANGPTTWAWTFTGGTPETSTEQNPVVQYNTMGLYAVSLTVTNPYGSSSVTKTDYILVGVDGLKPSNQPDVSLFPNPSEGMFKLSVPAGMQFRADVFAPSGITFKSLLTGSAETEMDLSLQPKGLYIVRITNLATGEQQFRKLILK